MVNSQVTGCFSVNIKSSMAWKLQEGFSTLSMRLMLHMHTLWANLTYEQRGKYLNKLLANGNKNHIITK